MSKIKQFEEEAAKADKEFAAMFSDPVGETKDPETVPDPAPEPVVEEAAQEPVTTPDPVPEPNDLEKKYKDSLKGMNEAQRKAAEAAKIAEEANRRAQEAEDRLKEILEDAKKPKEPTKVEPVDDDLEELERDLPEVAKIVKRNAERVKSELERRLADFEKWKNAQEERVKLTEQETLARTIYSEVSKIHPDYEQVVNSDEMVAWINNEAPPIFRAIFDGSVPSTAKDRILVLDAFKQSTTPAKKVVTASTPGAAEIAAPVKTNTQISTKPKSDEPLTEKDLDYFMHNSHKMSAEELAKWESRISSALTP